MTVSVYDNGHRYVGSGVWSSRQIEPAIRIDSAYGNEFHGDAITVKLPGRGLVFLVPQGLPGEGDSAPLLPESLFSRAWPVEVTRDRVETFRRISEMTGQTRTSPCDFNIPSGRGIGGWKEHDLLCLMMAFTKDPSDPHGVVSIPKGQSEAVIGKGVRIGRIRITITDEKVTRTIWDVLPWLADVPTIEQRLASRFTIPDTVVEEVHSMRRSR